MLTGVISYYVLPFTGAATGELSRRLLSFCILAGLSLYLVYLFWRALDPPPARPHNTGGPVTPRALLAFQLLANILFVLMYLISLLVPTNDAGLLVLAAAGSIFVLLAIYWRALKVPAAQPVRREDGGRRRNAGGVHNAAFSDASTDL